MRPYIDIFLHSQCLLYTQSPHYDFQNRVVATIYRIESFYLYSPYLRK